MRIEPAERLNHLPVYLFDDLDNQKAAAIAKGIDVIDLGVGDPDRPTPGYIIDVLCEKARDDRYHHYPSFKGLPEYRQAVAGWYKRRFGVDLDPNSEVLSLIGSKIGVALLPFALCNPGDMVLIPNPCYTAYRPGITLAGAAIHEMPLHEKNGFLPDLTEIPTDVAKKARLMLLNHPGNPTAALATPKYFADVVAFANQYNIAVSHDAPYSEATFDGEVALSFLQTPGAKEVGVEFHSCSKVFNMPGWRCAYCSGNSTIVGALGKVRSNIDMGQFEPVQLAAAAALNGSMDHPQRMAKMYQDRRDALCGGLDELGWKVIWPKATFFVWTRVPCDTKSGEFAKALLDKAGVLVSPGSAFGSMGEGYIRIALTVEVDRIKQAVERIKTAGFVYC